MTTLIHERQATPAVAGERRTFQFSVRGIPGPQGSKDFKGFAPKKGGGRRAIMAESSKLVAPWRGDVIRAAVDAIEADESWEPFTGPVHVIIEFYMPRPRADSARRRTVPDKTPDLDKLVRATFDAIKMAAVYRDDAQVVDLTTRKRYAAQGNRDISHAWELPGTGAVITIEALTAEDTWADMPLDLAARRFLAQRLPEGLDADATDLFDMSSSHAALVPAEVTDAAAKKLCERFERDLDKPDRPSTLVIEDGFRRLASVPGKPLSDLQLRVQAITATGAHVVLAKEVLL